ncbi:hypothetical protein BXZ70DRAFT_442136 [Cristinia sonorae]|uniref:Thioesterase n=1 Tax=Cristinia sonorae TaxID=1940300 RepID=A0A8K0XMA3_9AGAR|nr:hypothetical protein BXZ70DRAFT_442136 [Cristinia sonorae]
MPGPSVSKFTQVAPVAFGLLRRALHFSSLYKQFYIIIATLLFINIRSFPLVWHVRLLRHLIGWNLRRALSMDVTKYMEETSPVAQDPFKKEVSHSYWAGPDDCDFLGHLSNSAYAKNLDIVRMKVCVSNLRPFMLQGGFMPLAGADYAYLSEIPLFSYYEVRANVAGWDDKWIYLYSEFVTRPQSSKAAKRLEIATETAAQMTLDVPKHKPRSVRPDGTVLHCVAISRYCFKLGRLTVPPRIALGVCGFGEDRTNWNRSAAMQAQGTLRRFLEGGWRDQKGWDLPEFEEQRRAGMEWCRQLTLGINAAAP